MRPHWWPAAESWPPRHGRFGIRRHSRVQFFRRVAVVALGVLVLAVSSMLAAVWLIAQRFGASDSMATATVAVGLLAATAVIVLMTGAMRHFMSSLGQVMEAADRVADGDYAVRVRAHGPPPIRALAHSFNTMTERLEHADRLRRDLMADLAHELRTPLAVLQGRLEGLLDGVYQPDERQLTELLAETRVLERLIGDLRTLALSDAGTLPLQKEQTDLAALVEDDVRRMEAEAASKGVTLEANTSAQRLTVDLDAVRIKEVLTNLLGNALRHTPGGGRITVSVTGTPDMASVTVADTGEGMAPDEVGRMFDRFYSRHPPATLGKGPQSRGSGLGLAIAKGIVTAHGGDITATSQQGKGTTVTFTLPK